MARVELSLAAVEDVDALIRSHSLPDDTHERVRRSLPPLARFPRMGPELAGRWAGFCFLLGPWRWMVLVYLHMEQEDRVVAVTVQDARSSGAATGHR